MTKKFKLKRAISKEDGVVHYIPAHGEFDPFETYCGSCDTCQEGVNAYEPTTKKVTCAVCLHTANVFKDGCIL